MTTSASKDRARICMLTSAHPVFDVRIFHKEARSLAKAGYNVVLLAHHNRQEVVGGVRIRPLPGAKNRLTRTTIVIFRLLRLALKENADIYHFHDPELIPIGILLKLFGKKAIYDVHELVFHALEDKSWLGPSILRKIAQLSYKIMEGIAVKTMDHLILAEDDYQTYYNSTYKNFSNYTVVRNYPILFLIDNAPPTGRTCGTKSVLLYAGGLTRIRGITEMIQAMELVRNRAELWLLGKWESNAFQKECQDLEGWKYTRYLEAIS